MQNQEDSTSLKNRKKEEIIVVNLLRLSGALSIFTTLGIISILSEVILKSSIKYFLTLFVIAIILTLLLLLNILNV